MKTTTYLIILVVIIAGGFLLLRNGSEESEIVVNDSENLNDSMPIPTEEGIGDGGEELIIEEDEFVLEEAEGFEAPEFKLVEYSDDGFSPKEIEIEVGETVRFFNSSDKNMWIGSNDHPTHTNYPEKTETDCLGSAFDQCEAVQNGEFWEFTFNTAGTHGYHNHSRAFHLGTVIVR